MAYYSGVLAGSHPDGKASKPVVANAELIMPDESMTVCIGDGNAGNEHSPSLRPILQYCAGSGDNHD